MLLWRQIHPTKKPEHYRQGASPGRDREECGGDVLHVRCARRYKGRSADDRCHEGSTTRSSIWIRVRRYRLREFLTYALIGFPPLCAICEVRWTHQTSV